MKPLLPLFSLLLCSQLAFASTNAIDKDLQQVNVSPYVSADEQAEQLAQSAKSLGRLIDYEDALQELVDVYPSSSKAHYWLATILRQKNKHHQALTHYEQAIRYEPADQSARLDYAQLLSDMRRNDSAIEQVEFVLRLDPAYFIARSHLASLYSKENRTQEAIEQYLLVQQAAPNHPRAQEAASRLKLLYIKKATELSRTLKTPQDIEHAVSETHTWVQQKHVEPAIWLLKKILDKSPDHADANYLLGFTYLEQSQLDDALPFLKKAVEQAKNNQRYYSIYAQTLARAGKLEEAEEILRRSLTVTKDLSAEKLIYQRINLVTGESQLKNGFPQAALDTYQDMLDEDSHNIPVLHRISDIYITIGNNAAAEKIQQQIIDTQKLQEDIARKFDIARTHITRNEIRKAGPLLVEIVRTMPSHAQAWYQLSVVHARTGNFKQAILSMNRSIDLSPENENLRKEFARLLVHAGQLDRARSMYVQLANIQDTPARRKEFLRLAQHVVGRGLMQQNKLPQALQHYQAMALQFTDDLTVLDALASINIQLNLIDDALNNLKVSLEKNSARSETHIRLAGLYQRLENMELRRYHFAQAIKHDLIGPTGKKALDHLLLSAREARTKRRYDYALAEFETILSVLPGQEAAAAGAAFSAMQLGKYETSRKYYLRVIHQFPNEMSIRIEYARLLIRTKELELSIQEFESIHERSPRSVEGLDANANLDILYNSRADEIMEELDKKSDNEIDEIVEKTRIWVIEKRRYNAAQRLLLEIIKLKPDNSKAQFWLGHIYDQYRNFDKAIDHIIKSIALSPDNLQLQAAFARVLARAGNLPMAEALYQRILRLTPNSTLGRETKIFFDFIIGQQLVTDGELDTALAHYKAMLDRKPHDAGIKARIANVYMNQKRYAKAEAVFEDVLKAQPKSPAVHMQLAILYHRRGDNDRHMEALRKVVELDPRGSLGRQALDKLGLNEGMKFLLTKEWEKAIIAFQELLTVEPSNTQARLGMATAYMELEKYEESRNILALVIRQAPSHMGARLRYAQVLVTTGSIGEATIELERIVASTPDTRIGREALVNLTNIYKERGANLLKQGHGDEAVKEYQKSIKVWPEDWEAHYELARIFQSGSRNSRGKQRKQFMDVALYHYDEVAKYKPDHYFTYLNSAAIYEELQRHEAATRAYAYALANLSEENKALSTMLGNMTRLQAVRQEFEKKNIDWVIAELSDMIALEPTNPRLHLYFSTVYLHIEDFDNAIKELNTVVELTPGNTSARYRLGQILEQDSDLVLAADQYRGILLTGQSGGIIEAARERLLSVEERLRLISIRMSYNQTSSKTTGEGLYNFDRGIYSVADRQFDSGIGFSSTLRFNMTANIRPIKRMDLSFNFSPTLQNYHDTGANSYTPMYSISTRYTYRKGHFGANVGRFTSGQLDSDEPAGTETNASFSAGRRLQIPALFSESGATTPSTVSLNLSYRNFESQDFSFYRITSYSSNTGFVYPFRTGGALQASYAFTDTRPNLDRANDYANYAHRVSLTLSKPLFTRIYGSIGGHATYEAYKYADSLTENNGKKRTTAQAGLNASLSYQIHRKLSFYLDASVIEHRTSLKRGIGGAELIKGDDQIIRIGNFTNFQSSTLGDFRSYRANLGMQFQF